MCRHYAIVYWCGHVKNEKACILPLDRNCNNMTRNMYNIVSIPSHCPECIVDPKFPTSAEQTFISLPEPDRLVEAEHIWTRLISVLYGVDSERNGNPHPHYSPVLPEQDLDQLYYWLQLLQESRRTPESWFGPRAFGINMDKDVMLQALYFIVLNEIHARERNVTALDLDNQNLLTHVEIEDLEEDNRDCPICREPYGEAPVVGEVPEITVRLPCGHVFGEVCIISALKEVSWNCPYCRRPYDKDEFMLNRSPEVIASPWWIEWLKRPIE